MLLDIEQIAPCMPGAVLDSVDGDDFTGRVKVKLGPISLTYKGKASFIKKDEATHTAVIDAAGKDQRGNGTAAATVTATLKDQGGTSTQVEVRTDLNITGKPAQFGRGVMIDVGNKLIGQFATCVEGKLSGSDGSAGGAADSAQTLTDRSAAPVGAAAAVVATEAADVSGATSGNIAASGTVTPGGRHSKEAKAAAPAAAATGEPEPIDLLEVAGASVMTRIGIPAAGLGVAVAILLFIIRKIRR